MDITKKKAQKLFFKIDKKIEFFRAAQSIGKSGVIIRIAAAINRDAPYLGTILNGQICGELTAELLCDYAEVDRLDFFEYRDVD